MDALIDRLNQYLIKREADNALRILKTDVTGVDFSSNDYLGFAKDPQLRELIMERIGSLNRIGSGGSRLLTGNNALVEDLENTIAGFHHAGTALLFNSGYEANAGLIATVCRRGDLIVFDALCHASLREGMQLSHARSISFAHNDVAHLEKLLKQSANQKFIVTESVFSMDGDLCPLHGIVRIAEKYNAAIILDEAHATGVIGERGEGLAQSLRLEQYLFARVHTFGKAIGMNGAAVLGDAVLRRYLINFCKPFIYTTAPNMLLLEAVYAAYAYLNQNPAFVKQLQALIMHFNAEAKRLNLPFIPSDSAIHCLIISGNAQVKAAANALAERGFDVRPILSPTVAAGAERLRICLHIYNTKEEISQVLQTISDLLQR